MITLTSLEGGVCADVSNPDDVEVAFKQVDDIIGGIDILVSNAGISFRKPFVETEFAFLASSEAQYITGTAITVDGGESA